MDASELLRIEPENRLAAHMQKTALYALMPWKRRLDKAMQYLLGVRSVLTSKGSQTQENIRLLDKAASQKCKSLMPEILAKRCDNHYTANR